MLESRSILLLVHALVSICALPAQGMDELLVYREDYTGEGSYPTSPEVDGVRAGGLQGGSMPGPGAGPTLSGAAAHVSVSDGGLEGTFFQTNTIGSGPVGIRGSFANLTLASEAAAITGVLGLFDVPGGTASVGAVVDIARDPAGDLDGAFLLIVGPGTSFTIANAEAEALASGSAFVLDLVVDRGQATAAASLDIAGFPTIDTGLVAIDPATSGGTVAEVSQLHGAGPGSGLSEVDLTSLELYRPVSSSFAVDTLGDEIDSSLGDGVCLGASGFCSLRAAIQESNAVPGPGEIVIPAGSYVLTIPGSGEDEASTGDLDILEDLVLRGEGRDSTLVDAGGLDRVFDLPFSSASVSAHLLDLEISNGAVGVAQQGGGINSWVRVYLDRCRISGNVAELAGGVMNRGDLTIDECIIEGNEATFRDGALASGSTSTGGHAEATALIRNSAIVGNLAPQTGGADFGNARMARVENTTISGNSGNQLRFFNTDVSLDHVTVVASAGAAISGGSFNGTETFEISNSAVEGSPACTLSTSAPAMTILSGRNASNDTTCGFAGADDVEGVPLGLLPLASVGSSQAHVPAVGSPLIDAADTSLCLPADQLGAPRPMDGDLSGGAECDIGAIEVPEPASALMLLAGLASLLTIARVRGSRRPRRSARVRSRVPCGS